MSLGAKLIKYRHSKGFSQPQTANLLGVAQSTYSDWESDKSRPKPQNYLKIAELYDLDLKELMSDVPNITMGDNNSNNSITNVIDSPNLKMESNAAILKLADGLDKLVLLVEKLIEKTNK
jgi:transcriptional regulator with XRE-family HTH domain